MSNLATITNNILADSGIDDINVVVTNGSYANPAWITSLAWTKITGAPTSIVTGSGTNNRVAKFTSTGTTIGNSNISDDGSGVIVTGGAVMTSGWNRNTILEAQFPVLVYNSNGSKWAGIGYDHSAGLRIWVNASSSNVSSVGDALFIANSGEATFASSVTSGSIIKSTRFSTSSGYISLSSGSSGNMLPLLECITENTGVGMYITLNRASSISGITSFLQTAFRFTTEFTLTSSNLFELQNNYSTRFSVSASGVTTLFNLAGSGTRMVVADASGTLSTQAVPTSGVTGSGTNDYLSKWSGGGTTLTNSSVFDNGQRVDFLGAGTTINGGWTVNQMNRSIYPVISFNSTASPNRYAGIGYEASPNSGLYFWVNSNDLNGISLGTNVALALKNDRSVEIFGPVSISRSPMTSQASYNYRNIIVTSGFGGGYTDARIQSLLAGYDGNFYGVDIGYSYDGGGAGNLGYSLRFSTNDDLTGNPIERLRINSIGAATFSSSATVSGSFQSSGTTPYWVFQSTGAGGTGYLGFGASLISGSAATDFILRSDNVLKFAVGNSNSMVINTSGNVLIGTTSDVGSKLYVDGTIRTSGSFVGAGLLEFVGAWSASPYNGSSWIRAANGVGLFLVNNSITKWAGFKPNSDFDINGGNFYVHSSNGNVGVGTDVDSGNRLDVNGSARINGLLTSGSSVSNGDFRIISNATPFVIQGRDIYNRNFLCLSWNISPDMGVIFGNTLGFNVNSNPGVTSGTRALTLTLTGLTAIGNYHDFFTNAGATLSFDMNSTRSRFYQQIIVDGTVNANGQVQANTVFVRNTTGATDIGYLGSRSDWTGGPSNLDMAIGTYRPNMCFFTNNSTIESMRITSDGQLNMNQTGGNSWKINIIQNGLLGGENGIRIQSGYYPALSFSGTAGFSGGGKLVVNTFATGYGAQSLNGSLLLQSNNDLQFSAGGDNVAMTIASSTRFVGINTTSISCPLHVNGGPAMSGGWNRTALLQATFPVLVFNSNNSKWAGIGYDFSGGQAFIVWVNANSENVTTSTAALFIAGSGAATFSSSVTATSFFESSDKRLKSDIIDLDVNVSSIIAKTYLKNGIKEIGYLAQDVESILPSAISKRDDGYLDLSYRQVHTAKIAYLEKRITELEQQLKNN